MGHFKLVVVLVAVCMLSVGVAFGQDPGKMNNRNVDAASPLQSDSPATRLTVAAGPQAVVPRLMKFSGVVHDAVGKPLTGTVDVTFSLYNTESGGSPLWFETQSVQADELGRYTALLGAMHADGLPIDLFTSGEVRWLGIQVGTEAEQQPRVLLVSVPYALKAGDAETLGGKPASAYMLSETQSGTASTTATLATRSGTPQAGTGGETRKSQSTSKSPLTSCSSVTSDGTAAPNSITLFTTACNIQSANLVQFNGNLGFGTTTPQARLHIFGPDNTDSDARFNFILGDSTPAAAGTGGGILFSGYYNGTTNKAGLANIRGIKENSIQGNYATAMVFDTRANGGNQTEQMRINSAGNLGIGTSNPAHKLDVAGDINALTSGTSTAIVGTNTGTANDGVDGIASNVAGTGAGVYGESDSNAGYGVFGYAGAASGTTYGVYGQSLSSNGIGVYGQGGQWAGYFAGNVNATGTVTAPAFNGTATNAVALGGLPASGYAPATGSTSYIANGITPQTASLNITGSGTFGGAVTGGAGTFNGVVSAAGALLPATGAATTSAGFNSNALDLIASVYNSGTPAAQNETFQWQAEPVASSNNTASPSATMNLLFGANNSTPAETGLSIASNGVIAFAPSQNFGSSSTVITGSTATFTGGTTSGGVLSATQSGTGAAAVLTNSSTGDILDASNGSGSVYKITNSGGITSAGLVIQPSVTETNGTTNCTSGTPCTSANMLGGYLGTAGVANQIGLGVTGATIAGGGGNFGKNYVLTDWGTIAGGYGNHMTDGCIAPDCLGNTISGGANNTEGLGGYLTIAGGFHNSASGTGDTAGGYATVGGGWYNGAGKSYATVPGGKANLADGRYSFAAGCQAKANDDGAFVWSGYNGTACTTVSSSNTIAGQFIALAPGGFTFYPDVVSAAPAHPVTITTGGSMSLPGNLTVTGTITGANVGIGTSTPAAELNLANGSGTSYSDTLLLGNSTTKGLELADNGGGGLDIKTFGEALFINYGTGQNTYINGSSGNVGIGTISPDATLSVNGTADKPSGGSWATFSDERLKTIDGSFALGLAQVLRLNPVVYRYKNQNAMGISDHQPHVGLVAQEVQKAIPEAVSTNNKGYLLVNNDPIIWAMLNAIKEQQAEIAKLQRASAAKNAQMVAMKLQIDELRKAQQQMAVVVARLAQQQVGHIHVANSGSASHSRPKLKRSARTEVARVRF